MSSATYEELSALDPTKTYLFRPAVLLEVLLAKVKVRFLVEICRLLMLGLYDDFRKFVEAADKADARSGTAEECEAVLLYKSEAAEKIGALLERLKTLEALDYMGRPLAHYLLDPGRADDLRLFVRATRLEREADAKIDEAKKQFLKSFARRTLSKSQRSAMLQKYEELAETNAGRLNFPAGR